MCQTLMCPYCQTPRPAFAIAKTNRWQMNLLQDGATPLPHRLFHPFSFTSSDTTEYEADVSLTAKTAKRVRGTSQFPAELTFEFIEGAK